MKYIIGAILGVMVGGGFEFEHERYAVTRLTYELGNAYGCGLIAGKISMVKPPVIDEPQNFVERPWCAEYRKIWDAPAK